GKRRVDALRIEFDRFGSFEDGLSATRQERSDAAARPATLAAGAGVAGSLLVVLVFTGYLTRTIVQPVRRAAAIAGRLAAGELADECSVGARLEPASAGVVAAVLRTGRAAQRENVDRDLGPVARARQQGIRSAVAGPVVVEGRLWGVMAAGWRGSARLSPEVEGRLGQFTDLVA